MCAVSLSGCTTSPAPSAFLPALTPRGESGLLDMMSGQTYSVELLAVRDSSVVILRGQRVGVAFFRDIRGASFGEFSFGQFGQQRPSLKTIEKGRAASRFPYGIAEPALKALLEHAHQTVPDTVRR